MNSDEQTKRKGRPPKAKDDLWSIPARLEIDPENPVRCLVHFADGQVRNLDCQSVQASGDKLYITRRRGMVSSTITIPLHHLRLWEKRQLLEAQELVLPPTKEVVSHSGEVAFSEPESAVYVPDKAKAKADFVKHVRGAGSDYVAESPVVEAARPLTGETLLGKAKNNG